MKWDRDKDIEQLSKEIQSAFDLPDTKERDKILKDLGVASLAQGRRIISYTKKRKAYKHEDHH